jgi:hypothetical protein
MLVESFGHCTSLNVFDGNDFRPAGKPVYHGQEVLIPLGFGKRTDQVYVDMLKTAGGWCEGLERCFDMGLDF